MDQLNDEIILERIERWQKGLFFHPYTCGVDSRHKPLKGIVKDRVLLSCSNCDYVQEVPSLFYSEEFETVFSYCYKLFRKV